jgi:hypothetical protein
MVGRLARCRATRSQAGALHDHIARVLSGNSSLAGATRQDLPDNLCHGTRQLDKRSGRNNLAAILPAAALGRHNIVVSFQQHNPTDAPTIRVAVATECTGCAASRPIGTPSIGCRWRFIMSSWRE